MNNPTAVILTSVVQVEYFLYKQQTHHTFVNISMMSDRFKTHI